MSARIHRWHNVPGCLPAALLQRAIDLTFRINPILRLVPELQNPGCAIFLPEYLMKIINPGIDNGYKHSFSAQIWRCLLQQIHTRGCLCLVNGKEQPLWFFNVFNLRKCADVRDQAFLHGQDRVLVTHLFHRSAKLPCRIQAPGVFYDQLPGLFFRVIAGLQLRRAAPFFSSGVQGKV